MCIGACKHNVLEVLCVRLGTSLHGGLLIQAIPSTLQSHSNKQYSISHS